MKNILFLLLTFCFVPVITSCQPSLTEFQPENDSLFKITFSYPDNWVWEEQIPFDEVSPGEELPPSELIVLQEGGIYIQVFMPPNPQELMQYWMDSYVNAVGSWLRSDTIIQIDGYDARQVTVVTPQPVGEPSFSESVYLNTGDRFYIIDFHARESESDSRLHKQFAELIESIRILPQDNGVEFVSTEYTADEPVAPGSGGVDMWTFKAVSSGETQTLGSYPPGVTESEQKVTFNIVVK